MSAPKRKPTARRSNPFCELQDAATSPAATVRSRSSYKYRDLALVALAQIKPHPHNARTHSNKQIRQIADSIRAVGFAAPVLIDEHDVLLAGHGRLEAAKLLGLKTIPAIVVDGLSEAKKRVLLLADNRIAQNAGWDRERLAGELLSLPELLIADGLDITVTGFEPAEIDALLSDFENDASDPADEIDPCTACRPCGQPDQAISGKWASIGCCAAMRAIPSTWTG